MNYDDNVYYNPEKHGLVVVAEMDYSDGGYEFDTTVVWYHPESHRFYTASDSGCSCPTPFEDFTGIGGHTPIEPLTDTRQLRAEVNERSNWRGFSFEAAAMFIDKVEIALRDSAPELVALREALDSLG